MSVMQVQLLHGHAKMPFCASAASAGWDLFAKEDTVLAPHERALLDLGIAIAIPQHHFGMIASRSSMAKRGIDVCAGVVDSDYRGPVKVLLCNHAEQSHCIRAGDRIAQLLVLPFAASMQCIRVESLQKTERGEGGFGSTGQ